MEATWDWRLPGVCRRLTGSDRLLSTRSVDKLAYVRCLRRRYFEWRPDWPPRDSGLAVGLLVQ
jgi:hypothetical protein